MLKPMNYQLNYPLWLTTTRRQTWVNAILHFLHRVRWIILVICIISLVEVIDHNSRFNVPRPRVPLDEPFQYGCQEPDVSASAPRENAVVVMLGRNEDLHKMLPTLQMFDRQFNHWAKYPIVFLNDDDWDPRVVEAVRSHVSGEAIFDNIDSSLWGYSKGLDMERAKANMYWQGNHGVRYGNMAGYHHMCRFFSGTFFDHPVLKKYKWYLRLDDDVSFTSAITYDPFVEMAKHNKTYGYTIAFGEMRNSVPTLWQEVTNFKKANNVPTTRMWKAITADAWAPWPMRQLGRLIPPLLYNEDGDAWNACQFWSNFEIGDMDFYRSKKYRDFFEYLDSTGGFYYERWGDAAVHTLGLALFLEPEQIHYFADIGYAHDGFENCPQSATEDARHSSRDEDPSAVLTRRWGSSGFSNGVGCRVECGPKVHKNPTMDGCLRVFRRIVEPS